MPISKCSNGKYRIGDGECMYTSRENAEEAYQAYLAESNKDKNMDETKYVKKSTGIYNYKNFNHNNTSLTIKDVDPVQGIVTGYFSAFGIVDSDGDMIMPGAFKRSIQDWGPKGKGRVKHLYNHDPGQPLGLIKELDEDNYGLRYVSKVGTHSLGRDFIKMVESGLITEHSIGFRTLREQKASNHNEIHDVMLYEGSSLSAWGANMETPLLGMKSEQNLEQLQKQIKAFESFVRNCDVTEETLDLCLIKIKQLAQAIEQMSSTDAVEETPPQQKDDMLELSLINILNKI